MASSKETNSPEVSNAFGYVANGKVFLKNTDGTEDREIGFVKGSPEQALEYFENRFLHLHEKVDQIGKDIAQADNKGSYLQKILHFRDSLDQQNALGDFGLLKEKLDELQQSLEGQIKENREKNLEIKKALLAAALENNQRSDWKEASDFFKELQEKWMKTGPIDEELKEEVEGGYEKALEVFYEARKTHNEKRREQLERNLSIYKSLFKEYEELRDDTVIPISRKVHMMNQLKNRWKKVGYAPKKETFKLFRDINGFHNYLIKEVKQQEKELIKKNAFGHLLTKHSSRDIKPVLVEEARNLFSKPLLEAYALMQDLQKVWKESGPIKERDQFPLINQFNDYCERIDVLYTLETTVRLQNPGYEEAEDKGKLNMKIDIVKDMVRQTQEIVDKEQQELDDLTEARGDVRSIKRQKNNLSNLRRKHKILNLLLKKLLNQVQELMLRR